MNDRICATDGCPGKYYAKGLCRQCYEKAKRVPKPKRARAICKYEDAETGRCVEFVHGQGLCPKHYQTLRDLSAYADCSVEACDAPATLKGWCKNHYYLLRDGLPCLVGDCVKPAQTRGYCHDHQKRAGGKYSFTCPECGTGFTANEPDRVFCSRACKHEAAVGPVYHAAREGNWNAILAGARASSIDKQLTDKAVPGGPCWVWQFARNSAGYAVVGQGAKGGLVHRRVMEAVLERKLTSRHEVVHHRCGKGAEGCVNPEHLERTTQGPNMAEMFARVYYESQITELQARVTELEAKLAATEPSPLEPRNLDRWWEDGRWHYPVD